jgi:MerR family transcriptional regulator, light-induced transcriptional regulator
MVPANASSPASNQTRAHYRSGAVARMLEMPVATLRIWESRYQVSRSSTSPCGHRLYSPADVQRLALIKQLTTQGHAIRTLAPLSRQELEQIACDPARAFEPVAPSVWSVVVVGCVLGQRLSQTGVQQRLGFGLDCSAVFDTLEQAALGRTTPNQDVLLVRYPSVQNDTLNLLQAAACSVDTPKIGLIYSYASQACCDQLLKAGIYLLREPHTDIELAQWLRSMRVVATPLPTKTLFTTHPVRRPRFSESTLLDITRLSSRIACECPSHLAQLLIQLAQFETYSTQCAQRSPSDALLHTQLSQVTASARVLFEDALERVATHEGLSLQRI